MPLDRDQNAPTIGEATGEASPDSPQDQTVGEATGEYRPDSASPVEPTVGEATGEFRPASAPDATACLDDAGAIGATADFSLDEQAPVCGATADFGAAPGSRVGDQTEGLTGEFIPAREAAADATGEFVSEDQPRGGATQARRRDGATADRLAGATGDPDASDAGSPRMATLRRRGHLTGGDAPLAPDAPLVSDRYDFKKLAGKGGMGEVWLAEDVTIGRPVAVKRMLKARRDLEERFLHEAQVTGQLEHPGIIPVHEVGKDERGQAYYVMKFVQGETLQKVIADYHAEVKPGDPPREVQELRLLSIFLTLCQTVAYAHSRGVIHRDLKPDNVMIGAYGETLLLDWGLAKVVGAPENEAADERQVQLSGTEESHATMMGSAKGTPTYFSPEAAAGLVHEVDQVSDVYLLGGILFSILTGKPPRTAAKVRELITMAKDKPVDPPRSLKPDVPKALNAICAKAMAHAKKDRYPTAAELAEDVQRYLAGEPVGAYQESFWEKTWRWAKKHRTALLRSAGALVVLGVVITGYALIQDANRKREEGIRAAEEKTKREQERADFLKAQDTAREQISAFRGLADKARYLASLADQATDQAPVMDIQRALDKGNEAVAAAKPWGPNVDDIPLEDERPGLRKEIYALLLEMAQVATRQPGPAAAREALALLDRAEKLQPPTRGYHRLRAHCLGVLDQDDKGKEDLVKADDPTLPTTALDHYLLAEQLRRESMRPEKSSRPAAARESRRFLPPVQETLLRAMAEYNAALAIAPKHYWSHYQLGSCYLGLGRAAEASQKFAACIALKPEAPWGYASRALALSSLGEFKAAHADLKTALDLDRDFTQGTLYRGMVHAQQKDYDKAFADFAEVLALPPEKKLVEAAFSRAQLHLEKHDYDKALADLALLDEAKLNIRNAHLHRARIHLAQMKGGPLLESLTAYLVGRAEADIKDPALLEKRARELRILANELPVGAVKQREFAYGLLLSQLELAYKYGGKTASLFGEIGAMEELLASTRPMDALKHIRAALASYGKGIDIAPKDVKLRNKRGWVLVGVKLNKEALEDFQAAIRSDPANAEAHTGLGYALAKMKDGPGAMRHANLALLHGGGDYLILHNVACIFAVLARNEGARHYEDLAVDQVIRAVELWRNGGMTEPNELRLIEVESAFDDEFKNRPEIRKLLAER